MTRLIEGWKRVPRGVREFLVVGVAAVVLLYAWPLVVGGGDAQRAAVAFLSSHPAVEARIGRVTRIHNVGRRHLGCTPGTTLGVLDLEAIGERGSIRAEVKVEKQAGGSWEVYSAVLFTSQGPVPLRQEGEDASPP